MDFARSADPAVQRQLDRLASLSPGRDVLGLERISELLRRLGDPHDRLPPVLHVAGTNGKGSTCAFLRAAIEAAGLIAHVYSSPHLVRFNERIRIAGTLIADEMLAALLAEVLDVAAGVDASFFEVTTAAAFLAFARVPADACVIEVGLGGRLDATNVIARPAACGIAQLGIDHQAFLGDSAVEIAGEKAGIAKRGAPLVTMDYAAPLAARVAAVAEAAGATVLARRRDWDSAVYRERLHYRDARGRIEAPLPRLPGAHQASNAALAIAMLRHQDAVAVPDAALKAATLWAEWPARIQRLEPGPLADRLPPGTPLWLDGGHNPAAGESIAAHFRSTLGDSKLHLVLGMLANKDPAGLLAPFAGLVASIHPVPVPHHEHHAPEALAKLAAELLRVPAAPAADPAAALAAIDAPGPVLILGSLYLAGEVLAANGQLPD